MATIKIRTGQQNLLTGRGSFNVPYGFWADDFYRYFFFLFFAFMLPWQPVKMSTEQNNHLPLNEHFWRSFVKNICNGLIINAIFLFSHYKSMAILSCHSNQIWRLIFIKTEEMSFECVNDAYADDGRRTNAYPISSPGAFGSGELNKNLSGLNTWTFDWKATFSIGT